MPWSLYLLADYRARKFERKKQNPKYEYSESQPEWNENNCYTILTLGRLYTISGWGYYNEVTQHLYDYYAQNCECFIWFYFLPLKKVKV